MSVKPLPEQDHVVRHVKKRALRTNNEQEVIGVNAEAFRYRGDEDSLSACWEEFYEGVPDKTAAAIKHFCSIFGVKKGDRFIRGCVGAIKGAALERGQKIRIVHEPENGHNAHASVRQLDDSNAELLEALAAEHWAELYSPILK